MYVLPFNAVDNKPVANQSPPATKKTKRDKNETAEDDLIDYQLGGVIAEYKNFQNHDGMGDYEFILTLLVTSILGFLFKLCSTFLSPLVSNEGIMKGFFEDQNIDIYLLFFIAICYITLLWKNLFNLGTMKIHRTHCFYMTGATLLLCLFISLGYDRFFLGKVREAVYSLNVGLTALITSTLSFNKTQTGIDYLSLNGFSWIVTFTTCLIVFLTAPGIIKFVDSFQVYRKSIKQYEEALEELKQDKETKESNERLLKQYRLGNGVMILNLIAQTLVILLHIKSINKIFFGENSHLGEVGLAFTLLGSICFEMYGTFREVKDRSHHIFQLLIRYKPKTKLHKDLFVSKCHQIYKESLRHVLHALGKSVLPLIFLILILIFLRKNLIESENSGKSTIGLQTVVEPSLSQILWQTSHCPIQREKGVTTVIRGYGVCVGLESIDIYSKTPFRLTGGLNVGHFMNNAILSYLRLVLMNFSICKYLFTIGYMLIVITTNEEIE